MQRRGFLKTALASAAGLSAQPLLMGMQAQADVIKGGDLTATLATDGTLDRLQSGSAASQRVWLEGAPTLSVCNEATGISDSPVNGQIKALDLAVSSKWSAGRFGLIWDLAFQGSGKRAGHEITIDFPVLSPELRIFTPSNDPEAQVSARPTFRPVPYGTPGWKTGTAYVLPLITVLDPKTDQALTVALPPNVNIPHLQFEWIGGRIVRMTLGYRAMGAGKASPLRLLFYSHAADYRGALKAYSDDFPEYFEAPLPRGHSEGVFWYHHIQDHPEYSEMARQHVRYLWASFWFQYLGDYLPEGSEWAPYTYAKHWKLHQMMSDAKINAFIAEMKQHQIGVFAYFNLTEYGGAGGVDGKADAATHLLQTKFADSLVNDVAGREVPTWEGACLVNPRADGPIWAELKRQCERHLARLPGFEGFIIDRLDWASKYDYGHDDGFTMLADRAVENMTQPVAAAVQSICRRSHAAHKRVFVNQFWRVELLRDVDGYCQEHDVIPALAYLAPYRPLSAWEKPRDYQGDLLPFEKQMKVRLEWAVFPQMIAHQFPISQQPPNPHAADFLEVYAPLFDPLIGKRQVLLPHCVAATGENDVNLFLNGEGAYVAPLTSRTRHRSRDATEVEEVTITIKTPDAGKIRLAEVISADGPSYSAKVSASLGLATIQVAKHGTASVVVARK